MFEKTLLLFFFSLTLSCDSNSIPVDYSGSYSGKVGVSIVNIELTDEGDFYLATIMNEGYDTEIAQCSDDGNMLLCRQGSAPVSMTIEQLNSTQILVDVGSVSGVLDRI